jgi:hypothetical protein
MVDGGRVVLSSYAGEVFFFCFGDLEAVENGFDFCRDLVPLVIRFFGREPFSCEFGFCVIYKVFELEAGKVGSEGGIFAIKKNLQTMQSMLKHSIWLVEVCGNLFDSVCCKSFEKGFVGNGVCLL